MTVKVDYIDNKGKVTKQVDLEVAVFGTDPKETLLRQYIRVYLANQRQGTSSTKTRGDVSGGGKKPHRQKGTGRARAGSSRNPVWVHGGISHGPQPKSWNLSLSKKMKQGAMKTALSIKATANAVKVTDDFNFKSPKAKDAKNFIDAFAKDARKTLIVMMGNDKNCIKSFANLKNVRTTNATTLNAYEVLNSDLVVFENGALEIVNSRYAK